MGELERLRGHISELEDRLRVAEARADSVAREAELQQSRAIELSARLSAILSISAALLISRDVDAIVQLVVREAVGLFPGTSAVHLFLIDPDSDRLVLRASSSNGERHCCPALAQMAIPAPRAMLLVGPELDLALERMDAAELTSLRASIPSWPPCSALLGPLRVESTRIGAIVLYGGVSAHLSPPT